MKVRNGFVSNSSSCSFLIVGVSAYGGRDGVDLSETVKEMAKADGCEEMGWGGYSEGRTLVFLGGEGGYDDEEYEPNYVGIEAEQDLKNNKTIGELKQEFLDKVKALGFEIPEERVDLHYGEVSSE